MTELKTWNFAVIGTGVFGEEHMKMIESHPKATLWGICDQRKERLEELGEKYHVQNLFQDADELLSHDECDVVIIATDESSHLTLTELAVNKGKHVLLEKPVCLSKEDGRKLLSTTKSYDKLVLPAHILRYDSSYAKVKEQLDDHRLGSLHSIKFKRNVPIERFSLHSRTHPVFMSLSHDIDLMIWYTGKKPKSVYAKQKKITEDNDAAGIIFAIIELEDGTLCQLETQWCLPNEYGQYLDVEMEVMGTDGHLVLKYPGDNLKVMAKGQLSQPDTSLATSVHGIPNGALANQLDGYIRCLDGESSSPVINMEEAVTGVAICEAIIEACETEKEIIWRDFFDEVN
ncbi:Gfo/Idh/MocA family oxidoreductase [Bacillus shivajii]|uniref:Gfo/Idh/MocA family protein n=1 Tax=Bacillus shivajii TaxID=1983719 RepID=UPI001CFB5056|nr:Gfo/Idh/MocA family oxidoreductase [Bacillus shivajii]UCZ52887.1 Gfo/Idh/MocA family oxidoreductase [Bacillus shivajii]